MKPESARNSVSGCASTSTSANSPVCRWNRSRSSCPSPRANQCCRPDVTACADSTPSASSPNITPVSTPRARSSGVEPASAIAIGTSASAM